MKWNPPFMRVTIGLCLVEGRNSNYVTNVGVWFGLVPNPNPRTRAEDIEAFKAENWKKIHWLVHTNSDIAARSKITRGKAMI